MRDLARFYAALADETRLRLLCLMRSGELCVCHLQGVLGTNQPKISRHLAYLKRAGLVEARRDGRWMHYRLSKLNNGLNRNVALALDQLQSHPKIKADRAKLKGIVCCP